jgi:hypothetical protein
VVPNTARPTPPASYQPQTYFEPCGKCRGTGQTPWGVCFRCKGNKGKTFKTSPAARAKAQESSIARKERQMVERKNERETWEAAHKAEMEWLRAAARKNDERGGGFDFPINMINAVNRYLALTDNQLAAVRKLMARDAERNAARDAERAAREAAAPAVDVSKLEAAFDKAKAKARKAGAMGIKRLHLRLQSGEHSLSFSPGSPGSQWDGMIFVREAGANGEKLGSVKNGKFTRRFACTDAQEAAILDACTDPLKAALAYGQKWSACAVCGRELTNDGSIERGIGPICAGKYGW